MVEIVAAQSFEPYRAADFQCALAAAEQKHPQGLDTNQRHSLTADLAHGLPNPPPI
jgi:hypothetical protein